MRGLGCFGGVDRALWHCRAPCFWTLLGGSAVLLSVWLVVPLLKWARIGKGLSHEEASALIGQHFPEISDRLLNVLQLQRQLGAGSRPSDTSLLEASIEERASALQPVAFKRAIDWEKSKGLLRYALPVLAIASGCGFGARLGQGPRAAPCAPPRFVLLLSHSWLMTS